MLGKVLTAVLLASSSTRSIGIVSAVIAAEGYR